MQYNLYKPNTKSTGCAFSFKVIEKDKEGNPTKPTFLIQAIKQASWDQTRNLDLLVRMPKTQRKICIVR